MDEWSSNVFTLFEDVLHWRRRRKQVSQEMWTKLSYIPLSIGLIANVLQVDEEEWQEATKGIEGACQMYDHQMLIHSVHSTIYLTRFGVCRVDRLYVLYSTSRRAAIAKFPNNLLVKPCHACLALLQSRYWSSLLTLFYSSILRTIRFQNPPHCCSCVSVN